MVGGSPYYAGGFQRGLLEEQNVRTSYPQSIAGISLNTPSYFRNVGLAL